MKEYTIFYRWRGRHYQTTMRHWSAYDAVCAASVMVMDGAKIYGIEGGEMNWNCDGDGNTRGPHADGEVRVMRTGGDSNLILCQRCWERELQYRRERNRELGDFAKHDLPTWESGKVYGGAA